MIARYWYLPVIALLAAGLLWLRADLQTVTTERDAANARATASETARVREVANGKSSFEALSRSCDAGLKLAVTRGRTIERSISSPPRADGSRGMLRADGLRDIVGEAPAAGRP